MPTPNQSNPGSPIPVAVLGSGARARRLLSLLGTLSSDFKTMGFYTTDPSRRSQLEGEGLGPGHTSAAALCAQSRLAIVTGLPDTHLSQSLMALETGCDLVVEKPVALRADDVSILQSAEAKAGRRAFVFHPHRFQEGLDELATFARATRVLSVRLTSRRFRPASRYAHPARRDPLRVGPGPLWDMGVHLVDLLDFVMPCRVVSANGTHKTVGLDFPLPNVSSIQGVGAQHAAPSEGSMNRAPTSENTFDLKIEINDAAPGRPRLEIEITTEHGTLLWANGRLIRGPLQRLLHTLRPRATPVRDGDFLRAVAASVHGTPDPRLSTLESAVRVTGNLERLHPPQA